MKLLQIWGWRVMFKDEKQDEQFIKAFLEVKERTSGLWAL